MNILIHKVNIQFKLKSGLVNVIVERLPREEVDIVLGNDLAGRKVKTISQPYATGVQKKFPK